MPYLKAITTAGFLVSPEVINAKLKLTITVAKKLDAASITSCKDVIQPFRNNEEILVGLF